MKINKSIVILALISGVTIEAIQALRNAGQRLAQQAPEIRQAAQNAFQAARTQGQAAVEATQNGIREMGAPGAKEEAISQLRDQFQPLRTSLKSFWNKVTNRAGDLTQRGLQTAFEAGLGAQDALETGQAMMRSAPNAVGNAARAYVQGAKQFYGTEVPTAVRNAAGRVSSSVNATLDASPRFNNAMARADQAMGKMYDQAQGARQGLSSGLQSLSKTTKSKLAGLRERLSGLNPFSWGTKAPAAPTALSVEVQPRNFDLVGEAYPQDSAFKLVGSPFTPKSTVPNALVPYVAKGGALMPIEMGFEESILPAPAAHSQALPPIDPKIIEAYLEGEKATMERLGVLLQQAAKGIPVPTIAPEAVESYLDTSGLMPNEFVPQGDFYSLEGFAPASVVAPVQYPFTQDQNALFNSLRGFSGNESVLNPYTRGVITPLPKLSPRLILSSQEPQTSHLVSSEDLLPQHPAAVVVPTETKAPVALPSYKVNKEPFVQTEISREMEEDIDMSPAPSRPEYELSTKGFTPTGVSREMEEDIDMSPAPSRFKKSKPNLLVDTAPEITLNGTKKKAPTPKKTTANKKRSTK